MKGSGQLQLGWNQVAADSRHDTNSTNSLPFSPSSPLVSGEFHLPGGENGGLICEEEMTNGFVKIDRSLFSDWMWEEKREFSRAEAWIDLVQMAAFKPHTRSVRGNPVALQAGELIASIRFLATRWTWSKAKVGRFFERLEQEGLAARKPGHHTGQQAGQVESVISICNYGFCDEPEDPERDTMRDTNRDGRGTNKKKGRKREEGTEEPLSPKPDSEGAIVPFQPSADSQSKKPKPEPSERGLKFAQWFMDNRALGAVPPANWQKAWGKVFDLLTQKDGKDPKQLAEILTWGFADDFWSAQLQSASALRKRNKDGVMKIDSLAASFERHRRLQAQPKRKPVDLANTSCL